MGTTSVFIHAALACTLCAWSAGGRERGGIDPLLVLGLLLSPKIEPEAGARPRVRPQPGLARGRAKTTRARKAAPRPGIAGEGTPVPDRRAA